MKESLPWVSRTLGRLPRALTTSSSMGVLALLFSLSPISYLLISTFRSIPKSSQDLSILVNSHPDQFPWERKEDGNVTVQVLQGF